MQGLVSQKLGVYKHAQCRTNIATPCFEVSIHSFGELIHML